MKFTKFENDWSYTCSHVVTYGARRRTKTNRIGHLSTPRDLNQLELLHIHFCKNEISFKTVTTCILNLGHVGKEKKYSF